MENNDEEPKKEEKGEQEKIRDMIEKMAGGKESPVAKDLVELEHVEVKKQEVSAETIDLAKSLKEQVLEHDKFEELSNDELTILEAFMGRRLFLSRIAIIVNQSRIPLGIPGLTKADLEATLDGLAKKGYINGEIINENLVFWLTERGKYRVQ